MNFKLLTVMLLVTVAFSSCTKDKDEEAVKKNAFIYEGKTYETQVGYFTTYGKNDQEESADFDVFLVSSSITYDELTSEFSGIGESVYLDLNSPSLTELSSGTYTYQENRKANSIVDFGVSYNYNIATGAGTEINSNEGTTGNVVVNKTGDLYEITFDIILENGKKIEGYYKGKLELINY